jgi:hypothetical protein
VAGRWGRAAGERAAAAAAGVSGAPGCGRTQRREIHSRTARGRSSPGPGPGPRPGPGPERAPPHRAARPRTSPPPGVAARAEQVASALRPGKVYPRGRRRSWRGLRPPLEGRARPVPSVRSVRPAAAAGPQIRALPRRVCGTGSGWDRDPGPGRASSAPTSIGGGSGGGTRSLQPSPARPGPRTSPRTGAATDPCRAIPAGQ